MKTVIVNPINGFHCLAPEGGNLGAMGDQLLSSDAWQQLEVSDNLADHVRLEHTAVVDGAVVLMDEDDWPENNMNLEVL